MSHILVVEDDRDIAQLMVLYLSRAGHTVNLLGAGTDALRTAREARVDLVVLDLMLPGRDGLDVCRALRGDPTTAAIPIIMVTARAEEADRIAGLDLGADDYLTKPFSPRELVARVNALLRRSERRLTPSRVLRYGPLQIDLDRHIVTEHDREVRLTAKEFLLLQYMVERRGMVVSRDQLLTDVWGYQYTGGTRTVDVHIRRLREKLPAIAPAIATVKQFGYKLTQTGARADGG